MTGLPAKLWGVRRWRKISPDGVVSADNYIMRLPREQFGVMQDGPDQILYFFDRTKRDDFLAIFGGQSLTLDRRISTTHEGRAAAEILKRGAFG